MSLCRQILRLFKRGVLFDITVLEKFVKANIPELTFLEAYRMTRRVLNVTVTSASDKGVRSTGWSIDDGLGVRSGGEGGLKCGISSKARYQSPSSCAVACFGGAGRSGSRACVVAVAARDLDDPVLCGGTCVVAWAGLWSVVELLNSPQRPHLIRSTGVVRHSRRV